MVSFKNIATIGSKSILRGILYIRSNGELYLGQLLNKKVMNYVRSN